MFWVIAPLRSGGRPFRGSGESYPNRGASAGRRDWWDL